MYTCTSIIHHSFHANLEKKKGCQLLFLMTELKIHVYISFNIKSYLHQFRFLNLLKASLIFPLTKELHFSQSYYQTRKKML